MDVHDCINYFHFFIKISCLFLIIIIIIIGVIILPRLVGLGSVRGRKFTPNPKVKGHFLGVCLLYDMFVVVLLLDSLLLKMFLLNLYVPDILGSFW